MITTTRPIGLDIAAGSTTDQSSSYDIASGAHRLVDRTPTGRQNTDGRWKRYQEGNGHMNLAELEIIDYTP